MIGYAVLSILFLPISVNAQEVCCHCTPPNSNEKQCLTAQQNKLVNQGDCSSLPIDLDMPEGWKCDNAPLLSHQCKLIVENGICKDDPKSALSFIGESVDNQAEPDVAPPSTPPLNIQLNIPIPGIDFNAMEQGSILSNYIVGIFRYAISIVAVVATIMFIYGAFLYLVTASMENVRKGKDVMVDSVVGMLIVISSVTILRTINPATITYLPLDLESIKPVFQGNYRTEAVITPGQANTLGEKPANAEEQIGLGASLVPGVDPCVIIALCTVESGLRATWNGRHAGNPKENAKCFGPCQQCLQHLSPSIASSARKIFQNFPAPMAKAGRPTRAEYNAYGDYLNNNFAAAGYIAALTYRAMLSSSNNNEFLAVSSYYGGSASLKNWRKANNCTPQQGLAFRNGAPSNLERQACLPHLVGVPVGGNAETACPKDGYNCSNAKQDQKSQFVGTCSNGQKCFAAQTDHYVKSTLKFYSGIANRNDCTLGTGDVSRLAALSSAQSQQSSGGELNARGGILFIGDSLSVGMNSTMSRLVNGASITYLWGPGEVGSNIQQWAPGGQYHSRLSSGILKKPSIVLISLGTNDAFLNQSGEQRSADKLTSLIDYIETNGAEVYWIGPPALPDTYYGNSSQNTIIDEIRSVIPRNRYYDSTQLDIPRSSDTLHPTVPGYQSWANEVWNWMNR